MIILLVVYTFIASTMADMVKPLSRDAKPPHTIDHDASAEAGDMELLGTLPSVPNNQVYIVTVFGNLIC